MLAAALGGVFPQEMTLESNTEKWKEARGEGAAFAGQDPGLGTPLAFLLCEKQGVTRTASAAGPGAGSEMASSARTAW